MVKLLVVTCSMQYTNLTCKSYQDMILPFIHLNVLIGCHILTYLATLFAIVLHKLCKSFVPASTCKLQKTSVMTKAWVMYVCAHQTIGNHDISVLLYIAAQVLATLKMHSDAWKSYTLTLWRQSITKLLLLSSITGRLDPPFPLNWLLSQHWKHR